ncbi:hypothetical protein KAR34_02950 [bacterium]|nr:hypothetical protein [bacterium]
MDPQQYNFCIKLLGKLADLGVLEETILIGSWAELFYSNYFENKTLGKSIFYTRDMDFLVPKPSKLKSEIDLTEELKKLGFAADYSKISADVVQTIGKGI